MNTRATVVAVAVALLLGGYLLIFQRDIFQPRGPEPEPSTDGVTGRLVLDEAAADPKQVQKIRLERTGEPALVVERRGKGWVQTEPVRFEMDSIAMEEVLHLAVEERYNSTISPGRDGLSLEQIGLAPPLAKLTLESAGGKAVTLCLGKRGAAGGAYLTLGEPSAGGEVLVVDDALHRRLLDEDPRDWRSRTLATIVPSNVHRLMLRRGGESVELAQVDSRWELRAPVAGRADRGVVEPLVRLPETARIVAFVQDNPKDLAAYGLAEPVITLTLQSSFCPSGGALKAEDSGIHTHTLRIGGSQTLSGEQSFAMWDDVPVVFTLGKADVEKLRISLDGLHDARLTPADRASVNEVMVRRTGHEPIQFIRDATGWHFGDPPPPYGLDSGELGALMSAIFDTRATGFVPVDGVTGEPDAVVTLAFAGRQETETVTLNPHGNGAWLSVRAGESTGYVVDGEALAAVFRSDLAYRDKTVLAIDESEIAEVRVVRENAEYTFKRSEKGEWDLTGYDPIAFEALMQRVAPLMAESWVSKDMIENAAPSKGAWVELLLKSGERKIIVFYPESRLASFTDGEAFTIREDVASAVMAEFRDKVVLKERIDDWALVKVAGATISRDGSGKYTVEGGEGMTERQAAGIFDALSGLSAVRFQPDADRGTPTQTLTAITRDDKTYTLSLWAPRKPDEQWVGQLDDGLPFTLTAATAEQLLGKATPREAPDK